MHGQATGVLSVMPSESIDEGDAILEPIQEVTARQVRAEIERFTSSSARYWVILVVSRLVEIKMLNPDATANLQQALALVPTQEDLSTTRKRKRTGTGGRTRKRTKT